MKISDNLHLVLNGMLVLALTSQIILGQSNSGGGIRTAYKYRDCTDCGVCQERPRPICGTDGVTYFNPCHLGCEKSCNQRSKNFGLRPAYEGPCYQEPEPVQPVQQYQHQQQQHQQPETSYQPQPHNRFHVFNKP